MKNLLLWLAIAAVTGSFFVPDKVWSAILAAVGIVAVALVFLGFRIQLEVEVQRHRKDPEDGDDLSSPS